MYKGRNLAINKAKGKYIAFLDTDDFWDKNKLQEQIPKFKNKKIGLVYSNFFKFTKNQIRKIAYGFNLPSGNVTKKIIENYSVGFLTVVVKANLIKKKKKIFDYKYDLLADLDFILRLSLRTNFYGINKPLAYYRIHENQLQKKKMFTQAKQFCEWFKKKKIEENFKEFDLTNIINKYNYYDFIRTFNKSKIELLKKVIKNFSFKIFFKIIALIIMPNRIIKKLIHNV